MDLCRWLGAGTPQEYARCEEAMEWLASPIKKTVEAFGLSDDSLDGLKDFSLFRIPSVFSGSSALSLNSRTKTIELEMKRSVFSVENLLNLGGLILAAPPARIAFEIGKSGFDNIRRGLDYLGIDLSLENLRKRAALRSEKMKDLPLQRLTLLQEDLNTNIQEGLKNSKEGAWVKDLSIELKEGVIYLKGKVDLGLTDVDLEGEITFEVKNGNAEGRVVKLEAGGLSLPDMVKEKIIKSLKRYGVDVPKTPNFDDLSWFDVEGLQNLSIRDGKVVIDMIPG